MKKITLDKINNFFETFEHEDIKDFVLELFDLIIKDPEITNDDVTLKMPFFDLGFYDYAHDDLHVIDFYKLSQITPSLRKVIMKNLQKAIKIDKMSVFLENLILKDLKIVVEYEDWLKISRKNKLNVIRTNEK